MNHAVIIWVAVILLIPLLCSGFVLQLRTSHGHVHQSIQRPGIVVKHHHHHRLHLHLSESDDEGDVDVGADLPSRTTGRLKENSVIEYTNNKGIKALALVTALSKGG